MKLLLIGASGLVGQHVLKSALENPMITHVIALSRKALAEQEKLESIVVDFDNLPSVADWWNVDAVICTLGTTMRVAKTKTQFRKVDYVYPLEVAELAHKHGAKVFVLTSAMGAKSNSPFFYYQTKGEIEAAIQDIGFDSLTIARPGLIGGKRKESRLAEHLFQVITTYLSALLPKRMRLNPASIIAEKLLTAAIEHKSGTHIISSAQLIRNKNE